jgi:hypothetical protein
MHGEYKPPGGELVAADVEVAGGRMARVQISGDFFLDPDDTLDHVNAALTGIPATADSCVITARITAALGSDAVLARVTAEAGRHGMTVVRRISGGGAMFVEPGNTITYSLYAPESLVAGMSCAESYGYLDDWVIGALTDDLGVSAWYQPLNDITSAQGKIGGAAQKWLAGSAVLHHVTMAYDIEPARRPGCCASAGRSCRVRGFRARSSGSTRCVGRPGCRGPRSSTLWRRISAVATASPRTPSPAAGRVASDHAGQNAAHQIGPKGGGWLRHSYLGKPNLTMLWCLSVPARAGGCRGGISPTEGQWACAKRTRHQRRECGWAITAWRHRSPGRGPGAGCPGWDSWRCGGQAW